MADRSNATPRFRWLAGAGTVLAIAACYGTMATIGMLSLLGVTLAINKGVWAGTITLFALLALFGVLLSYRQHRVRGPLTIAAVGTVLVLWAMFGSYNRIVEIVGFSGLITAAIWDWRLKKCERADMCVPSQT
jgi:hypothetical protein